MDGLHRRDDSPPVALGPRRSLLRGPICRFIKQSLQLRFVLLMEVGGSGSKFVAVVVRLLHDIRQLLKQPQPRIGTLLAAPPPPTAPRLFSGLRSLPPQWRSRRRKQRADDGTSTRSGLSNELVEPTTLHNRYLRSILSRSAPPADETF